MLDQLATDVISRHGEDILRVAIDGVDGAGKTRFADELAAVLTARGVAVVRASVDGFHHPREVRHRRGRDSPEGFFLDSYDYDAFRRRLLEPLAPGGDRRIVRAVYDVDQERPVPLHVEVVAHPAMLLVDGIFLHRDELWRTWDHSVFLDVPFAVSIRRGAQRDDGDPDPDAPSNRRYVEGQRLYLRQCRPRQRADIVIDNQRLDRPRIVTGAATSST